MTNTNDTSATQAAYARWQQTNKQVEEAGMAILEAVASGDTKAYTRRVVDLEMLKVIAARQYTSLTTHTTGE